MARKSRKKDIKRDIDLSLEVTDSSYDEYTVPKRNNVSSGYKAALYARLSHETEVNRERNTIENQLNLMRAFVESKDDVEVVREYSDISKTGTNFDRPGFDAMMQDIREGTVNLVIVKDLSRLGRNYVDAGNYIERVFPFFDCRFIAINDNYDSLDNSGGLMLGLSNIINEHYSRDLGKKIRSSKRAIWEKGEYGEGSVAYGFMKDPLNKRRIVPDPEASGNVRLMFELFSEYKMYSKVAHDMNERGILPPRAYSIMKRKGSIPDDMRVRWIPEVIRQMLLNRIYIGDSVHGKVDNNKLRLQKRVRVPESEWLIVENTHEPIVSKELFNEVQNIIAEKNDKYTSAASSGEQKIAHKDLLKGYIYCADCGYKMYAKKQKGRRAAYNCVGYAIYKKACPSSHRVFMETVEDALLKVIHSHIITSLDTIDMIKRMNKRQDSERKYDFFESEISRIEHELERIKSHKRCLYRDFNGRIIDLEQFNGLMDMDRETEQRLKKKQEELLIEQGKYAKDFKTDSQWEKLILKYKNKRTLSREMVEAFVDRIEVHDDKTLDIRLKYDDILEGLIDNAHKRGE